MSFQATMKINVSESNGHPTRKFRNIRILKDMPFPVNEKDHETYSYEDLSIRLPSMLNCFNDLLAETVKKVAEHRANGISEKEMCEQNEEALRQKKITIILLGESIDRRERFGNNMEFAHLVITCAYLGAVKWGENFGIMLPDGTMPLVPEDEIGAVCRSIQQVARADMAKSEAEKKTAPPPAPPAEKKFTDHFTPASIDAGVSWFKIWIADGEGSSHQTLERYNEIFQDCKKWATGENGIDRNINFTWDATDTTRGEVDERLDEYYMKTKIFLYMLSIYNKGHSCNSVEGHRDFTIFNAEVKKSGFEILKQIAIDKVELVGFVGIYTKEEWDALQKGQLTAKLMLRDETQKKGAKLCCCGCGTFQKKLMKASCCGARYVDAEHQKKDWAEHKKECEKYRPAFYLPINREEELAMPLCDMSCVGCDFCEYKPRFVCV